ncbi:MAG TPA: hypothetical protein VN767_11035 [Streptosporangiaceae bacterium]|nr:hypothetical protein [Streptosporangiaceae bacterium]
MLPASTSRLEHLGMIALGTEANFFINYRPKYFMQFVVLIQEYPVASAKMKFSVIVIKHPHAVQDGEHAKDSMIGREAHYALHSFLILIAQRIEPRA